MSLHIIESDMPTAWRYQRQGNHSYVGARESPTGLHALTLTIRYRPGGRGGVYYSCASRFRFMAHASGMAGERVSPART